MAHPGTSTEEVSSLLQRCRSFVANTPLHAALKLMARELVVVYEGMTISDALLTLSAWHAHSAPVLRGSPPWLTVSKTAAAEGEDDDERFDDDPRSRLRAAGLTEQSASEPLPYPRLSDVVGWLSVSKVVDAVVTALDGVAADDSRTVSDALTSLWPLKLCEVFTISSYATDWDVMGATASDDTSSCMVRGVSTPHRSLSEVISSGFLAPKRTGGPLGAERPASGAHRIAVWTRSVPDVDSPGWSADSETEELSSDAVLVNIFSQSDAVTFLYRCCAADDGAAEATTDGACMRELASLSIAELGLGGGGGGDVVCVGAEVPLLDAFRKMVKHGVAGLGVVDEDGVLVGAFTKTDIKSLLPQHAAPTLTLDVAAYLESLHRLRYYSHAGLAAKKGADALKKHQHHMRGHFSLVSAMLAAGSPRIGGLPPPLAPVAVAAETVEGVEWGQPVGVLPPSERFGCAVAVKGGARLLDVLALMAEGTWGGYHSVFVVDGAGKAEGVISLSDVLRLFVD